MADWSIDILMVRSAISEIAFQKYIEDITNIHVTMSFREKKENILA